MEVDSIITTTIAQEKHIALICLAAYMAHLFLLILPLCTRRGGGFGLLPFHL